MTAYLGAENLLESADTVVASNEATGFEGTNAYDKRTSTWWKPGVLSSPQTETLTATFSTAQSVDFFGVMGHNLGTEGATITLQYLTGSPQTWTTLFTITPANDECIFRYTETAVSSTSLRVVITNCTASSLLAIAAFGAAVALPEGIKAPFMPTQYGRDKTISNAITEGGQFIGRSVYSEGYEVNIEQTLVEPGWVSKFYDLLMDRMEIAPFFFCWDYQGAQSNLIPYAEQFDQWSSANPCTITTNTAIAPDGTVTADDVEDDDPTTFESIQFEDSANPAKPYCGSLYFKKDAEATIVPMIRFTFSGSTIENNDVQIRTSTGEIYLREQGSSNVAYGVVSNGDYWRLWISGLSNDTANTTVKLQFYPASNDAFDGTTDATLTRTVTVWRGMLHTGSKPRPSLYTEESATNNAAYVWLEKPTHTKYTHQGGIYMDFAWKCKGLLE